MEPKTNAHELRIETGTIKKATLPFRALKHSLRLKILKLIHRNERMTVTDIYKQLALEQSVTSQHLALLRREKIVNNQREGKLIFYSVNYGRVKELEAFAGQLLNDETVKASDSEFSRIVRRSKNVKTISIINKKEQAPPKQFSIKMMISTSEKENTELLLNKFLKWVRSNGWICNGEIRSSQYEE